MMNTEATSISFLVDHGSRSLWRGGAISALTLVSFLGISGAAGQEISTEPEPFDTIPQELYTAAENSIKDDPNLAGAQLEFIAVISNKGIKVFKLGSIQEGMYHLDDVESPSTGQVVQVPKWSPKAGVELVSPREIDQTVTFTTASPGSGSDCRRGGSCRGSGTD